MVDSRITGFYKLSIDERREAVARALGIELGRLQRTLDSGGLTPAAADKVVENVLGVYALPFGVALNVRVNASDRLVPMVVEEPSVIAAASNAARMARAGGGFVAAVPEALMRGQVHVYDVSDSEAAKRRLGAAAAELLGSASSSVPDLVALGGGPRSLEVRVLDRATLVVDFFVDCRDAMGANMVNTIAEAMGPRVAELAGGALGLRILSNLCDRRTVRVRAEVPEQELLSSRGTSSDEPKAEGGRVADGIEVASRFAELDPYRATTHNKGIMNGVDAVVLATGNDFRAVEAGAHSYASRSGRYAPLATWRHRGPTLVGELEMPLALGTVGGTLRAHPAARLALELLGVTSASELAMVAASVGLASNLAALRALATEGIQKGHMALHARSVAITAEAEGDEVERVAAELARGGPVTLERAQAVLEGLRARR
ncbi:MAG: hydroxymethylglutaryl-CoA reductase, degradative [Polyangiaceae bacterium]|nr:hydroxymethylglutaryl-CoA reductase, degradative [Polyangiaceae bacterium]